MGRELDFLVAVSAVVDRDGSLVFESIGGCVWFSFTRSAGELSGEGREGRYVGR